MLGPGSNPVNILEGLASLREAFSALSNS